MPRVAQQHGIDVNAVAQRLQSHAVGIKSAHTVNTYRLRDVGQALVGRVLPIGVFHKRGGGRAVRVERHVGAAGTCRDHRVDRGAVEQRADTVAVAGQQPRQHRDELAALSEKLPDLERGVALLLAPRDKDAAKWLDGALQAVVAMTEDDTGVAEVSPLMEEGPASTSIARLNAFGGAHGDLVASWCRGEQPASFLGVWPETALINHRCRGHGGGI